MRSWHVATRRTQGEKLACGYKEAQGEKLACGYKEDTG